MPPKPEPRCEIAVKVTPRSSRNKVELNDEMLNVWTTAPPTDNQANEAVCEMVARAADVSKTSVEVILGTTSRRKRLRVNGLSLEDLIERLR